MSLPIEQYALISDCHTGALVGSDGSVDWLCLPRYDSSSAFGALLGDEDHGRWLLAPDDPTATSTRVYVDRTFLLVTRWVTSTGEVEVTDFMPHGDGRSDLVRRVRGVRGSVAMRQDLRIRFGYADAMPWVRQMEERGGNALLAVAGPDALVLRGPKLAASGHSHSGQFIVDAGETVDLVLSWFPSHLPDPGTLNVTFEMSRTARWWQDWARSYGHRGPYFEPVIRSLLVLRALTHEETGGIVAAVTTSLPEEFGGTRNWDYRYVWLRDAALSLSAFLGHSYVSEAQNWRNWLLRAIAGDPHDVQIMYGLAGERYLPERELTSLPGYQGAAPVRVGNAAVGQYQSDVIGEVMIALHEAREAGIKEDAFSWPLQRALMTLVEENWQRPDQGIWEVRGPERKFTHSRVMMWAAVDRAIRGVREFGLPGPVEEWERLRDTLREEIETHGFDEKRGTYTQYYGTDTVDASLLQLPQVGYCEADDPRMLGTVAAIEKDLMRGGLVCRYLTDPEMDGLPPGENPFLACSFWLVEQYARSGRLPEARDLMDRLVALCNDVGLLSEEYDVVAGRQAGNMPQALSHLALVQAADWIAKAEGEPGKADTRV
ncbi:glycoside hydrolase family 15 protein [Salinibacterium sp. ZJ450]|uniref:glycoside hydrolase family 15 protein n=1 Tax=Salinibacterium sp. ZJ450 TaxID=2708338 RepID=UPI00141E3769|nr:glycoside hydrolase family 15 protein [Salinibacterium sp. ZJ450]